MENQKLSKAQQNLVEGLVSHFETEKRLVATFGEQVLASLNQSIELGRLVHTIKTRIKDPSHLRDKLIRQMLRAQNKHEELGITKENILTRINDLAGIRLLHLHTRQISDIDPILRAIFEEQRYELAEMPFARTWDDESRAFYQAIGILPQESESMYTSVHYLIGSASKTPVTCEIQVRTLAEEVWGEVDHAINYPRPVDHVACREQIRALARATSTVTRLVDSIFTTYNDLESKSLRTSVEKRKPVHRKGATRKKT
jgi:ppGpp synthetase/RelA/SpoT-type nucleotidyltranferase